MNVYISTPTFDISGAVKIPLLDNRVDLGESRRRVNRSATLDGGVAVNDFGFSDGDRTLIISWKPRTEQFEANIKRIVEEYQRLTVSTIDGVYETAPEFYRRRALESTLQLLVVSKLSD